MFLIRFDFLVCFGDKSVYVKLGIVREVNYELF